VLLVWLGNLVSTGLVGYAVRATRISSIADTAAELCQAKLSDSLASIFILSVFCGILMFLDTTCLKNERRMCYYKL
jgi:formate/nitrite transporter FocA (FNT family)